MKSIQTKFIVLILSCVLLSSAVIGGAGILNSKRVVEADSVQVMNLMCEKKSQELDALLSRIEQSVQTLAVYTQDQLDSVERLKTEEAYVKEYTKQLESVAVNAAGNTEGAMAVYVRYNPEFTPPTSGLFWSKTSLNGSFQQLTPTDFSDYSPTDAEHVGWYYTPVKNGKATWMSPYLNQNIHVKMISFVIPLYVNNETIGVVGMDINFGIVEELVNNTRIYESGCGLLVDEGGVLMSYKDVPMGTQMGNLDKSLLAVENELKYGTSGHALFTYVENGVKKKMAFRPLRNGMRLAVTAPVSEIDATKNALMIQIAIAMDIIAIFSVLLTVIITRRLVRPLRELTTAAKKIADGDMNVSISHQTKDEVGTLADSFQQTVNHLQKYISYINGLAYRDPLTGVKNKTAYQEAERKLEEQMHLGCPEFALIVLDINGLKSVNDNYGHDFGDMMIIDACKLICKSFKHSPVFRIGGDEFVVILEGVDFDSYAELLKEFEVGMAERNWGVRPDSHFTIARGIAIYNSETDLVFANVFKRADEAMYQNKAAMKKQNPEIDLSHI